MVNSNLIKREFFLSLYLSLPYFLTTTCHISRNVVQETLILYGALRGGCE